MKSVALNASVRSETRRNGNKSLRSAGRIPAVIYGRQITPQNLSVDAKELDDLIHHGASENILVDLTVNDDAKSKRLALVQEVQHHPLTRKVLHVDFHEVSETEMVSIFVPVETAGEAAGVKTGGGVLEHVLFKIKVRALPKNLPEQIVLDVTGLQIGHSIHVGEIKAPEGVEIIGHKESVVVSCSAPRAEVEETPAATDAAAGEVEMIKEKKEDGAAEGAAAKAGDKAAAPAAAAKAGEKAGDKKAEKKK
jgi:large subunit ribosomal protein L25